MKLNKIFSMFAATAVVFGLTACADTDAQYTMVDVATPAVSKITPAESNVLAPGETTIQITYDKNIFFATANAGLITLNGEAVTSAEVIGSDSVLTITALVPAADQIVLNIPEGIVLNSRKVAAPALTATWTGRTIHVATAPANASATTEAKALYNLLLENYGTKTFSGAMANTNWNLDNTEAIYQLTGKYPAIATLDYIHIPYSGQNWFTSYDDLSVVTNWTDKGGIISNMWHWNVPTHAISAAVVDMPGDWSGNLQLTDEASLAILAQAKAGDKIVVHYRNSNGAQGSFKGSDWAGLVDGDGTSYDYFDLAAPGDWKSTGKVNATGATYELTLDETLAEAVKSGIIVSGHDYTLTAVNLVPAGDDEYTFRLGKGTFQCANALTEGTLENEIVKRDLAEIAGRLKALQDKGIPVLWRPLHEAAGNTEKFAGGTAWFWWGEAGAEQFKALWRYMYDYFAEQGVNNLLWIWTGDANETNWYPGDNYVDLIGADIYNVSSAADIAAQFSNMQAVYSNKMVTLSECGAIAGIEDIFSAGGTWSWFMPWPGNYEDGTPQASDEWWKAAMSSDKVLTLDDIK